MITRHERDSGHSTLVEAAVGKGVAPESVATAGSQLPIVRVACMGTREWRTHRRELLAQATCCGRGIGAPFL
jgi:hypothetical protein